MFDRLPEPACGAIEYDIEVRCRMKLYPLVMVFRLSNSKPSYGAVTKFY